MNRMSLLYARYAHIHTLQVSAFSGKHKLHNQNFVPVGFVMWVVLLTSKYAVGCVTAMWYGGGGIKFRRGSSHVVVLAG